VNLLFTAENAESAEIKPSLNPITENNYSPFSQREDVKNWEYPPHPTLSRQGRG
jgi:hypothetical protein